MRTVFTIQGAWFTWRTSDFPQQLYAKETTYNDSETTVRGKKHTERYSISFIRFPLDTGYQVQLNLDFM